MGARAYNTVITVSHLLEGVRIAKDSEYYGRERTHLWPNFDFEGWSFTCHNFVLVYERGVLYNVAGVNVPLDPISISELIEWEILTVRSGNYCALTWQECPECNIVSYFPLDYICHRCRHAQDAATTDSPTI